MFKDSGFTKGPLTELALHMHQTGLLATMVFYAVGFAVCALPGLVAAARGAGPWLVCTAVSGSEHKPMHTPRRYFKHWS
jgi:hypothetical protein